MLVLGHTYQGIRISKCELKKVVIPTIPPVLGFYRIFNCEYAQGHSLSFCNNWGKLLEVLNYSFTEYRTRQISIPVTRNLEHLACDFVHIHPMHLCFKPNEIKS